MFFRKKKEKKVDLKRRFGSFAFFLAIPVAALVSIVAFRTLSSIVTSDATDPARWALFVMGVLLGVAVLHGPRWQRLKTFIHEMKHAVLVLGTGNRLTKFSFGKHEGLVEYKVYKDNLRFEPFVLLAPYFLPLTSFPLVLLAVFAEPDWSYGFCFLIGWFLGVDGITAWEDLHSGQSDLKRIFGGYPVTRAFIIFVTGSWLLFCLLWIAAGNSGYLALVESSVQIAEQRVAELTGRGGPTAAIPGRF